MKMRLLLITLFITVAYANTNAQVTIGSSESPVSGALLQLKDKIGINNGDANASAGLGMPRVELTDETALYPMYTIAADATNAANKAEHTGLWVYNVTDADPFCPGLYVWSGTIWQSLKPCIMLKLNKDALALIVGQNETLIATVKPVGTPLVWSSSDTNVATVDQNGKVVAVGVGTATITVKETVTNKTASCVVNVETTLAINKTTLSLLVGSNETLMAAVNPSHSPLTWTSSNPAIATVDANGKVTALAKGTTIITVKEGIGNNTKTCMVNTYTTLSLTPTSLSLGFNQTGQLYATPAPAWSPLSWSSSNPAIATVDTNGLVRGVAQGSATITVREGIGNVAKTSNVTVAGPVTVTLDVMLPLRVCLPTAVGIEVHIKPQDAPNREVVWTSSNTTVATVQKTGFYTAKITFLKRGEVTITCSPVAGGIPYNRYFDTRPWTLGCGGGDN